jgi:hypothetical protein
MKKSHGDYVRHVQEETQRYSQHVLAENERLRAHVAVLASNREECDEKATMVGTLQASLDALRTERALLLADRQRLSEQVQRLTEDLARHEQSRLALEAQLSTAEGDGNRYAVEYLSVVHQNSNLANLYVAGYSLHGTLDRAELLQSIQEIVSNLIGSEEMALFELTPDGARLHLAASNGVDPKAFASVDLTDGLIGRVGGSGEPYLAGRDSPEGARPVEADLTACIPLLLAGKVTGVLAIFRLLSHKQRLEPLDGELFDLLTSQAAVALYCTSLHARQTALEEGRQ